MNNYPIREILNSLELGIFYNEISSDEKRCYVVFFQEFTSDKNSQLSLEHDYFKSIPKI